MSNTESEWSIPAFSKVRYFFEPWLNQSAHLIELGKKGQKKLIFLIKITPASNYVQMTQVQNSKTFFVNNQAPILSC